MTSTRRWLRAIIVICAFLFVFSASARADVDRAFTSLDIADVHLYSFMLDTGEMVREPPPQAADDPAILHSKPYPFPLDRHFIIGLRFHVVPGQASGYKLADGEGVRVTVNGRERHLWRDFFIHGRTYKDGILTPNAKAWKFVALDLVCDSTPVDVYFRGKRLRRIIVNGQCPE